MRLSESTWRNSKPMAKPKTRQTDLFSSQVLVDTETLGLGKFDWQPLLKITQPTVTVPAPVKAFLLREAKSYPKHQHRLIRRLQDALRRKHKVARFALMTKPIIRRVVSEAIASDFIVTVPIPASYWHNSAFDLTSFLESPGTFQ